MSPWVAEPKRKAQSAANGAIGIYRRGYRLLHRQQRAHGQLGLRRQTGSDEEGGVAIGALPRQPLQPVRPSARPSQRARAEADAAHEGGGRRPGTLYAMERTEYSTATFCSYDLSLRCAFILRSFLRTCRAKCRYRSVPCRYR